jgi:hypothetical protein
MSHISFSALKIWNDCSFRYKLYYEDGLDRGPGTEHTSFGVALHEAAELKVADDSVDEINIFQEAFKREITAIISKGANIDSKLIKEMTEQGTRLAPQIIPALKATFGNFTLLKAEEEIYEKLNFPEIDFNFKGYIDLIIKDEQGTIHIIDWKSCAWGWDSKKKADPILNYQLTLYKHFYSEKYKIDPKNIETHFALLKRTAKKDNVEIFRVTSGSKKTDNALKLLEKAVYNINKKMFIKNKLNCKYCEFKNTKECP